MVDGDETLPSVVEMKRAEFLSADSIGDQDRPRPISNSLCAAASFLSECRLSDGGEGHDGPTLPGSSRSLAIWCILRCRALVRPFVSLKWIMSIRESLYSIQLS